MNYSRKYIEALNKDNNFIQNNLEKVVRLLDIASGRYWNNGFGREQGQIEEDLEGLQNARIVARNMTFLMRGIALAKEKYGLPEKEEITFTHFIKNK